MACKGHSKVEMYDYYISLIIAHQLPVTITPLGSSKRGGSRTFTALPGLSPSTSAVVGFPHTYTVYNNTLVNMLEALCTRVFLVKGIAPPQPPEVGAYEELVPLRDYLASLLGRRPPLEYEEWISKAPAHRRPFYREAYKKLLTFGITDKSWKIKFFVKGSREFTSDLKRCRFIGPLEGEAILEKGIYAKAIEDATEDMPSLYAAIDRMWADKRGVRHKVCTKGLTTREVGKLVEDKWFEFSSPVGIGLDCESFSQSTGEDALKFVYELINQLVPESRDAYSLREVFGSTLIQDDDGIMYLLEAELPTMLMDGTPDTALTAHVIVNILCVYVFDKFGVYIEPLDCGDDFAFICEAGDVPDFESIKTLFNRAGYRVKLEHVAYELHDFLFCKAQPFRGRDYTVMIRDKECLRKDCLFMCQLSEVKDRMFATGIGGATINYGVPVYHNFYRCLVRLSGIRTRKSKHLSHLYTVNYNAYFALLQQADGFDATREVVYTVEERVAFSLTTGICPREQVFLESLYDSAECVEEINTQWMTYSFSGEMESLQHWM